MLIAELTVPVATTTSDGLAVIVVLEVDTVDVDGASVGAGFVIRFLIAPLSRSDSNVSILRLKYELIV